jgi:general secretion pathway protein D
VASSNALIISDRRANIERVQELINQLDRASDSDYSVYDMRHGWVQDAVQALQASLKQSQGSGTSNTQVLADSRSNRLIFLGTPQARARLLKLAQSLDTPTSRSANTRVIRLRHGDAKRLAATLGEISAGLKPAGGSDNAAQPLLIRADEDLNALVLLAEPTTVSLLEDIVRQLDVPRAQVLVEAAIVEMSGDISDALGVQWAIDGRDGKSGLGGVNFSNTGLSVGTLLGAIQSGTPPPGGLPDGAIVGVGNDNFGALITALSATGNSNLLSTPSLLTLDNQKAEILVGQNVPFQTGSYTTDAAGANNPFTTIERQDIGVSLKVTPHINEGATLRLEIEQEISSLAPSAQAVDLVTNKRSIKSTILADNGQVIVLGGLIQDDVTRSDSKVPLLGDLPLIGGLFRSSKDVKVKRNLMVFLRPSVVRDAAGLANLSKEKYQGIRVLDQASLLPNNPQQLFEPAAPAANALDLRPAATTPTAQPYAAPPRTLLEKPKAIDPATLGNGQGGESLSRAPSKPPLPLLAKANTALPTPPAKRYAIELISGTGEAYMLALLKRHPREPLRLQRDQRDGQPWFRVLYGNYPDRALAERVMASLPSELPQRRSQVVTL